MNKLAIMFICVFFALAGKAQNPTWINYVESNSNLPSNSITPMHVDGAGQIWSGTTAGLVRFDRNDFVVYDILNSGLPNNNVFWLTHSPANILWVGTQAGLASFDGTTWVTFTSTNSGLPDNNVRDIFIEDEDKMWVGTYGGGAVLFENGNWSVFDSSNSALTGMGMYVQAITKDNVGNYWFGTLSGLFKKDTLGNWTKYTQANSGIPSVNIFSLDTDNNGNVWVGTTGGLAQRLPDTSWQTYTPNTMGVNGANIRQIVVDDNGIIWCGTTGNGIIKYENGSFTNLTSQNSPLTNDNVRSVSFDTQDNIWFGTYGGGLHVTNDSGLTNITYQQTDTLSDPNDSLIYNDAGITIQFDSIAGNGSGDPVVVSVKHNIMKLLDALYSDSIATIFNYQSWTISTNVDSFLISICFKFDSLMLNTDALNMLTLVFQEETGMPWQVVDGQAYVSGGKICITTPHLSNWSIAITKPDARAIHSNTFENTNSTAKYFDLKDTLLGLDLQFRIPAGGKDTIKANIYDVNPGGNLPIGIKSLLGSYWELRSTPKDTLKVYVNPEIALGYKALNNAHYRILYRASALQDWTLLPTFRVKKGLKEEVFTKLSNGLSGQIAIGEAEDEIQLFSVQAIIQKDCAGLPTTLVGEVSGGYPEYTASWSGDNGLTGDSMSITHAYTDQGVYKYSVVVEDSSGAQARTDGSVNVDCIITSLENSLEKNHIIVYPNPIVGNIISLNVHSNLNSRMDLTFMDFLGKHVGKTQIRVVKGVQTISVSEIHLSPGIYFVRADFGGDSFVHKIYVAE